MIFSRRDMLAATAAAGAVTAATMAAMTTLYGIPNCDTVKKARVWLDAHKVAYAFHDYKTEGIAREKLEGWIKKVGWEVLLNRAGTTFKKLPTARLGAKTSLLRGPSCNFIGVCSEN